MKYCNKCSTDKPLDQFNKHKRMKDGRSSQCRECTRKADKKYREENPEKIAAGKAKCYQARKEHYNQKSKEWVSSNRERRRAIVNKSYQNNRESKLEYSKRYRLENLDVCKERIKNWELRNPDRVRAKCSRRRAAKINAEPSWLTKEDQDKIVLMYALAKDCEIITGDKYHVDHIVPLQGKNVCGLHVPWNLQVLPADLNLAKSNKHDPDLYGSTTERTAG